MQNAPQFIHTRTGEVIEITGTDAELSKIVTVTATGRTTRPRAVKTATLKATYLNRRGLPWKAAYVAIEALPDDHPLKPVEKAQETASAPSMRVELATPRFAKMTDEELSAYANARRSERERANDLLELAKVELKRRYAKPGSLISGNVYLEVSTNHRFDPKLAKSVLTSAEYAAILVPKPDPARARDILTKDRYKLVCKDHGNKLEIRSATDNDRRTIQQRKEIEDVKAEVDEVSFYPPDADLIDSPF